MENKSKENTLKIFLRIWGAATILVMSVNWSAFLFKMEAFNPGNSMHWLIWDDVNGHVAPMLFVIYIVWGIYFFVAAKDPARHRSFLNFTMLANLAHGLVMIPMAISDTSYHLRMLTDIPFILLTSLGIFLWMPSEQNELKTT